MCGIDHASIGVGVNVIGCEFVARFWVCDVDLSVVDVSDVCGDLHGRSAVRVRVGACVAACFGAHVDEFDVDCL